MRISVYLLLLLIFPLEMAFCQGADDVVPMLVRGLKDNFRARVVSNYVEHRASYQFTGLQESALMEGELTVVNIKVKTKERSRYLSMTSSDRISELIRYLERFDYRCLNISADSSLLTLENHFGSEQKNLLEIYVPPSAEKDIEVIHLQEFLFSYPDEIDEMRYFDQSLFDDLNVCESLYKRSGEYLNRYQVFYEVAEHSSTLKSIREVAMVTSPARTQWVKKKSDRNCLSADPNDCLVWCLVEMPEEIEAFNVVVDTTLNRNFTRRIIETRIKVSDVGFSEYRKVLCEDEITREIEDAIRDALNMRGYETGVFYPDLKAALGKFQRHMNLPVGQIDFETLSRL